MTKETWLWMHASVSLIAAAVAAMRRSSQQAERAEKPLDATEPDAVPT